MFDDWHQLRIDIDPQAHPDILADIADLSAIASNSADAIWAAHCLEHLYAHQVRPALAEFYRIVNPTGFVCIIVPDLQQIAHYIVDDRAHEIIYQAPAGPVTAHDILFGFGKAVAEGHWHMAHHCGFTSTLMLQRLSEIGFAEVVLRRRPNLELAAVVRKQPFGSSTERATLLARLKL
jgi:predicted SAM-dependent methyltransferase